MSENIINTSFKNILYAISSQIIAMLLSFVSSFILPLVLGIEDFGYWQIYLFYASYLPLFYIGFNDGIYLRYGEYDYNNLPFKKIRSSVRMFIYIQIIIAIFLTLLVVIFEKDSSKQFVLLSDVIFLPFSSISAITISVMLVSNRIKQYTFITILGKLLLLISIILLLIFRIKDYRIIVIIDQIIKICISLIGIYLCKEIFLGVSGSFRVGIVELKENMLSGISLLLAMLAGTFLIGIGRMLVERFLDIEQYSMYSFAFSATNLALSLVTSVGVVIYPTLKRVHESEIGKYYIKINSILCAISFLGILLYYPTIYIINHYIPKYSLVVEFLFILFPLIFIQAKIQVLINTYYKIIRKEKLMLFINLISIGVFLLMTIPIFIFYKSITLISITTLITCIFVCYLSEIYIKKSLNIESNKNIVLELSLVILFLIINYYNNQLIISISLYFIFYCFYIYLNREDLKVYQDALMNLLSSKIKDYLYS